MRATASRRSHCYSSSPARTD